MINTSTNISSVKNNVILFDVIQSCFVNIAFIYTSERDKSCVALPVAKDYILINFTKGNDKAIPVQAWTGPEGSRRLRLPDFKTIGT